MVRGWVPLHRATERFLRTRPAWESKVFNLLVSKMYFEWGEKRRDQDRPYQRFIYCKSPCTITVPKIIKLTHEKISEKQVRRMLKMYVERGILKLARKPHKTEIWLCDVQSLSQNMSTTMSSQKTVPTSQKTKDLSFDKNRGMSTTMSSHKSKSCPVTTRQPHESKEVKYPSDLFLRDYIDINIYCEQEKRDFYKNVWQGFLRIMEEKFDRHSFNTWIKPLRPMIRKKDQVLIIFSPNPSFHTWIKENYGDLISKAVSSLKSKYQDSIQIRFQPLNPPPDPQHQRPRSRARL